MGLSAEDILKRLDAAFKSITVADLGQTKLNPEKAARYVRAVEESTPMLRECRRVDMASHTRDIDRVGFTGRIMQKAVADTEPGSTSKPTFSQNKLVAVEAIAVVGILDEAMEDNLEKADFEDTLIDMMGRQSGKDLEELYVKGDTASGDDYLTLTDGWNKLAANAVSGAITDTAGGGNTTLSAKAGAGTAIISVASAANIVANDWVRIGAGWTQEYHQVDSVNVNDITLKTQLKYTHEVGEAVVEITAEPDFNKHNPEDMFEAMLNAVPKKYLQNPAEWRFYVHWDIENAYRDQLRARGTALGDKAQTSAAPVTYKGIPVQTVPNMPAGEALLTHPDNTAYGIYRDVRIERERLPKKRRTDFVLTVRTDCQYEDENAAVHASGWTG